MGKTPKYKWKQDSTILEKQRFILWGFYLSSCFIITILLSIKGTEVNVGL